MSFISRDEIIRICRIPISEFDRSNPRIGYRIVRDSSEMGDLMSNELIAQITENNENGRDTRAIIPLRADVLV